MAPPAPQAEAKKRKRDTAVKKVEGGNRRNVTFSKRKLGLFNKLTELSIMCQAETVLIIASPKDKLYACGYPSADAVLRRFLTRAPPLVATGHMRQFEEMLGTLRAQYQAADEKLKEEKKKVQDIKEEQSRFPEDVFWWESPIENMDFDDLEQFKKGLENLRVNVVMQQVSNNNLPPPQPQPLSMVPPPPPSHLQPLLVVPPPPQPSTNFPGSDNYYGWLQVQDGDIESGSASTISDSAIVTLPPFPASFDFDSGFDQYY